MKLAILAVLAFLAACNVNHKSEQYTCTKNLDCDPGRVCNEGFCVQTGTIVDAARGDASKGDAGAGCPAGCTTCNVQQKTCTINCMTANCTNTVSCPAGYKCDILCNTESSCRNGINCQQSASCSVECSGKQACANVTCGAGPCDVACSGPQSCKGVSCGSSCACDVVCTGNQSCGDEIQCSSVACRTGAGCTSEPFVCHSCN